MSSNQFGKKVFFLYPHSVIKSDLLHDFIQNEYEVYTLKDYKKVKLILKKYKDSIIFINIDDVLSETEWYEFVSSIVENDEFKGVQVGILTYNENEDLSKKYLIDLSVSAGFIQLKLGKEQSRNIILKTLEANESKGQRKYVRATSPNSKKSTFNVQVGTDLRTGYVNDISSVGMSCVFQEEVGLTKNAILRKIQLKLNGKLVLVDAIVFGSRKMENGKLVYVLMFTNNITDDNKSKIHAYIGDTIQSNMDKEISEIYGK